MLIAFHQIYFYNFRNTLLPYGFKRTLTVKHFYNWINQPAVKLMKYRLEKGQSTSETVSMSSMVPLSIIAAYYY
jgi:hypothetical protein